MELSAKARRVAGLSFFNLLIPLYRVNHNSSAIYFFWVSD